MNPIIKAYRYAQKNRLINQGKNWYKHANKLAQNLCLQYRISLDKCAGVISALSPGVTWEQNQTDATMLCQLYDLNLHNDAFTHHRFSTYSRNVLKAVEILNSDKKPIEYFSNNQCGFKTRHFYLNILEPKNNNGVTIDRHALAVSLGLNASPKQGLTKNQYYNCSDHYERIAGKVGVLPHELQAITWVAYKHAQSKGIEIY